MGLSISDIIQLCGVFASLVTGIIAIIISVVTLHQNSKMIEESTRPYIAIYQNYCFCLSLTSYLVLKNFGQTGATITKFTCSPSLKNSAIDNRMPFEHIVGTFIAPSQSIKATLDFSKSFPENKIYNIAIEYKTGKRLYADSIPVNLSAMSDAPIMRANTRDKELQTISYALQDISEKML